MPARCSTGAARPADGLERTFALNHMSYFTVTNLLLDRLKATPGARIVSTASDAHRRAQAGFRRPAIAPAAIRAFAVYSKSKLCNILFTRALAKRLAGTGVTANCLHPGFVATRFGDQSGGVMQRLVADRQAGGRRFRRRRAPRPSSIWPSSPDVATVSGEYFYQCKIDRADTRGAERCGCRTAVAVSAEIARTKSSTGSGGSG